MSRPFRRTRSTPAGLFTLNISPITFQRVHLRPRSNSLLSMLVRESIVNQILQNGPPAVAHSRNHAQSPLITNVPRYVESVCEGEIPVCAICLSEINVGDKIAILPCHHVFNLGCIQQWFNQNKTTCPICRNDCSN